uniref:BESS domain-containing protein n=1 Tax=Anopheles dirus TaxID=7168 RepID=A0A182NQH2_9DIPT
MPEKERDFNSALETLKRKWRCLRSQFRRELVRNKRTDTGRVLTKWKHYARLNFLAEESIHIKPHTPDPLPEQPSDPMEEILTVNYPLDAVNKVEKGNLPTVPSADTPNDSNYYFALSLVGLLNGIPKRRQMSARIAIMTTLNDFAENLQDD